MSENLLGPEVGPVETPILLKDMLLFVAITGATMAIGAMLTRVIVGPISPDTEAELYRLWSSILRSDTYERGSRPSGP